MIDIDPNFRLVDQIDAPEAMSFRAAIHFALESPRSGGRATGIGVAIVIAVGYWLVHSVAQRANVSPPCSVTRPETPGEPGERQPGSTGLYRKALGV